jgi:hypothetical protein
MNSSDNQIPPQTTAATFRAAHGLCFPYSRLPRALKYRVFRVLDFCPGTRRLRPDYAVNAPVCARRKAAWTALGNWSNGLSPTLGRKPACTFGKQSLTPPCEALRQFFATFWVKAWHFINAGHFSRGI